MLCAKMSPEYMGGHIEACEDCGSVRYAYNSCRNRHCPKCGAIDKEKWIGGQIGATAILHTWGQNLQYHPHVHFIIPAGALMPGNKWKQSRSRGKYLFKVEQLSEVFRARFVELARKLEEEKVITGKVPPNLYENDWVVFAKQAFGGPKQVISYLGRYTHRTAISNDRILAVNQETVTFTWKDYKHDYAGQITTLPGEEFIRLFCMHILPFGFTRIRHYGFLSSVSKRKSLAIIRADLNSAPPCEIHQRPWQEIAFEKMGINPGFCKCCGGKMAIIATIPNQFRKKQRAPPINRYNKTFPNNELILKDCNSVL